MLKRFFGLVLFIGATIGAYYCIINAQWQDDACRRFEPVKATLQSTHVQRHHKSKGGDTFSPEATYSYSFNGQRYTSKRVIPISASSNHSWAQGVIDRIERAAGGGNQATAYVNPRNPAEAILVREYSFIVHAVGMGVFFAAALGLGMLLGVVGAGRTKMEAVALDDSGWQLLLPQFQVRKGTRRAVLQFIGLAIALAIMPAHWIFVCGQAGVGGLISGGIYLGAVAVLGVIAFRRWSVSRNLSDARLRIRPAPMRRGEPFALDVGIDAQVPLRVTNMTAKILCTEHYQERRGNKTHTGTRTHVEKTIPLCGPMSVKPGEEIAGQGEVTFDASVPPTTDLVIKHYPYYTWEIRLTLVLEGVVDYAAVFPMEVD